MRKKVLKQVVVAATLGFAAPGSAQVANDTGVATETQERRAEGEDNDTPWDLLGLLGLAGLLGLKRRDDDRGGAR
jgi:hypothetical protein